MCGCTFIECYPHLLYWWRHSFHLVGLNMTHQYLDSRSGGHRSWMDLYHDLIYFDDSSRLCSRLWLCAWSQRADRAECVSVEVLSYTGGLCGVTEGWNAPSPCLVSSCQAPSAPPCGSPPLVFWVWRSSLSFTLHLHRRPWQNDSALWLSWCLHLRLKREKSSMCIMCPYGKLTIQIETWVFVVRLYAFLFVSSERENKLIYIFFRKWKLYYYKRFF